MFSYPMVFSESIVKQNRPMHTLPGYPTMSVDKRELMTEEKPLSRFIKDEMTRKEKLLREILEQTKLVKKRLDKYEKQIEMDNKNYDTVAVLRNGKLHLIITNQKVKSKLAH